MARKRTDTLVLGLVLALYVSGLAACSNGDNSQISGSRSTAPESSLTLFESDFGPALADDQGFSVYGYDGDGSTTSTCMTSCAQIFPPVPASGLSPGLGIDGSLIGSFPRTDEFGEQMTYAGRPLYRFSGDNLPGDALGAGSGGHWWLVGPSGESLTG